MHKTELAAALAEKLDIHPIVGAEMVKEVFNIITNTLAEGEPVTITGFGTFGVKKTAARTGRNPKTNEAVKIPAKYRVGFKPGKGLKEKVNG